MSRIPILSVMDEANKVDVTVDWNKYITQYIFVRHHSTGPWWHSMTTCSWYSGNKRIVKITPHLGSYTVILGI